MEYESLDQVVELVIDHRGKTATKLGGQWKAEGVPVLSANNLSEGQFAELDSVKHIAESLYAKWMPVELMQDDVLLVSEGATFGRVLYLRNKIRAAIGQRLFALRCKDNYVGRYLYYYLKSTKGQNELSSKTTGTSVLGIRQSELRKVMVPKVSVEEQKCVAQILGSIDDKIFLNNETNKTLEEIGQAIFKHWFIDFEFPNEKGMPYKSSGGEMAYNDQLRLELPVAWVVSKIGQEIETGGGTTPDTSEPGFWEGGDVNWATPRDLSSLTAPVLVHTGRKITKSGLAAIGSRRYPRGALLMSSRAPIGYLAISDIDTAVNQGMIAMICNGSLSRFFMLNWCRFNMERIESRANGTTFKEITKSNFRSIPIVVPPRSILSRFDEVAEPGYSKMTLNVKETESLARIRNTLLPKLMSGKMRVPVGAR